MPKQRSPDSYKAEEMYKQGIKLVEIANRLNVSEGTVRSWKNRYNFDEKSNATLQKNNRNVAKKNAAASLETEILSGMALRKETRMPRNTGSSPGISQRILGRFSFPWTQRIRWICCGTRLSWPTRQLCEPSILCMSETGKM